MEYVVVVHGAVLLLHQIPIVLGEEAKEMDYNSRYARRTYVYQQQQQTHKPIYYYLRTNSMDFYTILL